VISQLSPRRLKICRTFFVQTGLEKKVTASRQKNCCTKPGRRRKAEQSGTGSRHVPYERTLIIVSDDTRNNAACAKTGRGKTG